MPDPAQQEDLEKLREFAVYAVVGASGRSPRLRTFRTEAARTGFKRAWADRDCRTIVRVAESLPLSVL